MRGIRRQRKKADKDQHCDVCGQKNMSRQGFSMHLKRCMEDAEVRAQQRENRKREAEALLQNTPKRSRRAHPARQGNPSPGPSESPTAHLDPVDASLLPVAQEPEQSGSGSRLSPDIFAPDQLSGSSTTTAQQHENTGADNGAASSNTSSDPGPVQQEGAASSDALPPVRERMQNPVADDIRVTYHRKAGRPTVIYPFEKYQEERRKIDPGSLSSEPWKPFASRTDFEFAELVHEAAMDQEQISRLLKLIATISSGDSGFSFKTSADVNNAWELAEQRHPTFQQSTISVPYKGINQKLDFHSMPIWDFIVAQVKDPVLAPYFHWDAQRIYKYNQPKEKWVRLYHEPWTANKFWDVQSAISEINPDAKPLSLILWSDKAKLSSFGTQKGHPIVLRIGNLPADIRNGGSYGGGRVVGFIPVLKEDSKERKKTGYVDFKNAVFHASFREFLKDIAKISKVGDYVTGGDNIVRQLFPFLHILAADYEEQAYLALIRGLQGLFPCPVCLVPNEQLADLHTVHPLRVASENKILVEKQETKGEKEKVLHEISLRPVYNAFWDIANSDVHEAISWDGLHFDDLGAWGKHIWPETKQLFTDLGRDAEVQVDEGYKQAPRWPGLTHFSDGLMHVEFSDGSKWNDASKVVVPVVFRILPRDTIPKGYLLLKLIRKYVELHAWLNLSVQTDDTLAAIDFTIQQFEARLNDYRDACQNDEKPKNWDIIIKLHARVHAIRDIRAKGILANTTTKYNERLQGSIRVDYLNRTNKRKIEKQLAHLESRSSIATTIRAHVEAFDLCKAGVDSDEPEDAGDKKKPAVLRQFGQVYVGKHLPPTSIQSFIMPKDSQAPMDPAFTAFSFRVSKCLTDIIIRQHESGELPGEWNKKAFPVSNNDYITECQYLRIDYESKASWRQVTDRLRCNPDFFGQGPRYDHVLVDMDDTHSTICQLVRVFTYKTDGYTYALALVHPYDKVQIGPDQDVDEGLGLCRVRAKPRYSCVVVPVRSLIRGVLVIQDTLRKNEGLVVDTVDEDMFIRMIDIFPDRGMATV